MAFPRDERRRAGRRPVPASIRSADGAATPEDGQHLGEREAAPAAAVDGPSFGRRLAQARHEAGWMSQKTLAELLCVCRRSVQSYEAGKTIPYRHLHRLEEIFEKPASWFLYGTSPDSEASGDFERRLVERLDAQTRALRALAAEVRAIRTSLDDLRSSLPHADDVRSVRV